MGLAGSARLALAAEAGGVDGQVQRCPREDVEPQGGRQGQDDHGHHARPDGGAAGQPGPHPAVHESRSLMAQRGVAEISTPVTMTRCVPVQAGSQVMRLISRWDGCWAGWPGTGSSTARSVGSTHRLPVTRYVNWLSLVWMYTRSPAFSDGSDQN